MEVIPAIDLFAGRIVRLHKGRLERKTEYRGRPWQTAASFEEKGARWIHVVDLNAAFSGKPENLDTFRAIRKATTCRLQVGGGIRSGDSAQAWIDAGADRIVLSTLLSEDFATAAAIAEQFKGRVLASLDLRDGRFCIRGWKKTAPMPSLDAVRDAGFAGVVFTDVAADGTLCGQNGGMLDGMRIPMPFFVAGGVNGTDDVRALKAKGAAGVIVGKSIYESAFPLVEALEAARC
ncbi:1-(5-phosphoribosyl)-5-[(5-phosphoribosylamino)methylideneamino] imidazole-4-carboxamide isomerase [Candidatus Micrarchaeota archaeon]|nr:1-(5-phosphoribosyl)-5-[(5-phosphoribosylamino)methylideneamino] imidazole-4-carboxamide isomerase [Candidatus Micrarchaeota archaeon]